MSIKKERRPGESIWRWKRRVQSQDDSIYGGELTPAIVQDTGTIDSGTREIGRHGNDYRVGQKSLFGERRLVAPSDRSLAQRVGNWITDNLHLTSPPTIKDGYNRVVNAEVPITESATGQELERMKDTAAKGIQIASIPTLGYQFFYAPLATTMMLGAGAGAYSGTNWLLNKGNDYLSNNYGVSINPHVINTASIATSIPVGGAAKNYGDLVTRRGLELVMHETSAPNPAPDVQDWWRKVSNDDKRAALKYMFTGKGNNFLANRFGVPKYTGFFDHITSQNYADSPDAIRTYLYGEPLKGFKKVKNPNYGVHEEYIAKNYPDKKINVYEANNSRGHRNISLYEPYLTKSEGHPFSMYVRDLNGTPHEFNSAGHMFERGLTPDGWVTREQDIWKFNPHDYYQRWMGYRGYGWIKNLPLKWGLNIVDHYGTPFIMRTPWTYTTEISDIPTSNISTLKPTDIDPIGTRLKDLKTFFGGPR